MKFVCQIIIMFKRYLVAKRKLTTQEVFGCKTAVKQGFTAQYKAY
jgi:hypothetical protein